MIHSLFADGSTENFRHILDVNVLAVAICIREGSRLMRKHQVHGHIVNVNSVAGHEAYRVHVPLSIYCASKYAVTGLTQSVSIELEAAKTGIKITVSLLLPQHSILSSILHWIFWVEWFRFGQCFLSF